MSEDVLILGAVGDLVLEDVVPVLDPNVGFQEAGNESSGSFCFQRFVF